LAGTLRSISRQEAQELASAMTGIAAPDDLAGGRVESGEQTNETCARMIILL
jgi:hypothetical protein